MAIKKVVPTENNIEETKIDEPVTEAESVAETETKEETQTVNTDDTIEASDDSAKSEEIKDETAPTAIKTVRSQARTMASRGPARAMSVNKTEAEYKAFIEYISAGRSSKDIIRKVSDYKALNFKDTDVVSQLKSYQNNIGAFLEARSVIPTNTGIVFNKLQAGHTEVDALKAYQLQFGINDTYYKKMLDELSKGGIYGVMKAIQAGQISVPNNPLATSLKMQWNTSTELDFNKWIIQKPLLFTCRLSTSYPVYIAITPTNCQFRGVKNYVSSQSPSTAYSSRAQFGTFNNINTLNNTFSALELYINKSSHKINDVYLTVEIVNHASNPTINGGVGPVKIPTIYRFNVVKEGIQ